MKKRASGRAARLALAAVLCVAVQPADAQLGGLSRGGGIGGGLGGVLGGVLGGAVGRVGDLNDRLADRLAQDLDPSQLLEARREALDALIRAHPRELDRDFNGAPVVRGELLALSPSAEALARATAAGFTVRPVDGADPDLGLVILTPPAGETVRDGLKRLRQLDPEGRYDFNTLYLPSGAVGGATVPASSPEPASPHAAVGLIDTGVDTAAPALAHARVEQRGFAGPTVKPAAHGTAVASLIVGDAPPLRGSAPAGRLYAADVYGGAPTGGSATSLVRAVAWLMARPVAVINISLAGPPNLALEAAVHRALARGLAVVASVSNDGPAAPPAYPAAYPGVVSVAGVDGHDRPLMETGRADHLDFTAPGADMAAGGRVGFVAVRGASFAAPIVAGRLAAHIAEGDSAAAAVEALARQSVRHGREYGRGLVGVQYRVDPRRVGATVAD